MSTGPLDGPSAPETRGADAPPAAPPPAAAGADFELTGAFASAPEFARIRDGGDVLQTGARGDAVKVLDGALRDLGFLPASARPDDVFSRKTAGALATFQKQQGLDASGVLDKATLRKLCAATAAAAPSAGGPAAPATPAAGAGPLSQSAYRALVSQIPARVHLPAQIASLESPPQGKIPTPAELDSFEQDYFEKKNPELTTDLAGLDEIPFGYIPDGCYARAHIMDEILGSHGVDNAKIFAAGSLHAGDGNKYFPQGTDWAWHVAPLVVVNDGGKYDLRVIDPSIDQHPLTPEEWISRVDPSMTMLQVQVTSRDQYFPETDGKPSGESFEQNLKPADDTLKGYMTQLQQIATSKGLPDPATHYSGVVDAAPQRPAPDSKP
jgi:peptidoglycan hydrolase-like protein with peptidoglycan-binding domain